MGKKKIKDESKQWDGFLELCKMIERREIHTETFFTLREKYVSSAYEKGVELGEGIRDSLLMHVQRIRAIKSVTDAPGDRFIFIRTREVINYAKNREE